MNAVLIVSPDRVFARMLFLELAGDDIEIKVISGKVDISEVMTVAVDADLVVYDADYDNGNMSLVRQINVPCVLFSKKRIDNMPSNVIGFFERPFEVAKFVEFVYSNLVQSETDIHTAPQTRGESLTFDRTSKRFMYGDVAISLSPREYALLSLLYKNRGQVVLRKDVLDAVWGEDYDDKNNADNVYVSYLRKKLDDTFGVKMIYTIRGKGYMLK